MCRAISELPEGKVRGLIVRRGNEGFVFHWLDMLSNKNINMIERKIRFLERGNHYPILWHGGKWGLDQTINELNIKFNLPGVKKNCRLPLLAFAA